MSETTTSFSHDNTPPSVAVWRIVFWISIAAGLVLGTTISILGLLLEPINVEFKSSHEQSSAAVTGFLIAMALAMPVAGWLADRIEPRIVVLAGVVLTGISAIGSSTSDSIAVFIFFTALLGFGVGASATYVPGAVLISRWVSGRKGLAFGIFGAITSVGSAAGPYLMSSLLVRYDWRTALLSTAVAAGAAGLILCFFVPPTPSPRIDVKPCLAAARVFRPLKNASYWLVVTVQAFAQLSFMGIYFYIVAYLSHAGISREDATSLYSLTNLSSFFGFLLFGAMADRIGPKKALILGLVISIVGGGLILAANSSTLGIMAAILFAILWGAVSSLHNQLVALMLVNIASFGTFGFLYGMSSLISNLIASAGPMITGGVLDQYENYTVAFSVPIVAGMVALGCLVRIKQTASR